MVSSSTTAPSVLICHCPATRGAGQTVVATATSFGWNVAGLPRTDHSPAPGWDGRAVASFLHRKQAIQLSTKGLIQYRRLPVTMPMPCGIRRPCRRPSQDSWTVRAGRGRNKRMACDASVLVHQELPEPPLDSPRLLPGSCISISYADVSLPSCLQESQARRSASTWVMRSRKRQMSWTSLPCRDPGQDR